MFAFVNFTVYLCNQKKMPIFTMDNEQISVILENEGLSASQLAERLGVQRAMISHLQSGRNRVSMEMLKKIHHSFPHISLQWLLDQEGDYLKQDAASLPKQSSEMGSLFGDENVKKITDGEDDADFSKEREEKTPVFPHEDAVYQSVPIIEKPARKIVEIKVFYDDGTYENFHCSPK